jgi:hypothetical protein
MELYLQPDFYHDVAVRSFQAKEHLVLLQLYTIYIYIIS